MKPGTTEKQTSPKPKRKPPRSAWRKGESGNPTGMSKEWFEVRAAAQKEGLACITTLAALRDYSDNDMVRKLAADSLLDRGFGKSPVRIENADGSPVAGLILLPVSGDDE